MFLRHTSTDVRLGFSCIVARATENFLMASWGLGSLTTLHHRACYEVEFTQLSTLDTIFTLARQQMKTNHNGEVKKWHLLNLLEMSDLVCSESAANIHPIIGRKQGILE